MTHKYIGTKEVLAWPSPRTTQNVADGPSVTEEGYAVKYPDGYISWSPKRVFEDAYRVAEGDGQRLTFGDAIHFVKQGLRVARAGWNGKGMFVFLKAGSIDPNGSDCEKFAAGSFGGVDIHLFECGDTGTSTRMPNLNMRAADGSTVTGWLASQTDMLAEDWCVLLPAN